MSVLILHSVHACQSNAGCSLSSIKKKTKRGEKHTIWEVSMENPPNWVALEVFIIPLGPAGGGFYLCRLRGVSEPAS